MNISTRTQVNEKLDVMRAARMQLFFCFSFEVE
jgi:hypothetical protein